MHDGDVIKLGEDYNLNGGELEIITNLLLRNLFLMIKYTSSTSMYFNENNVSWRKSISRMAS